MSSSSSTTRIFARAGVVIRLSYSQAAPLPADAGHAGSVARILIAELHADVRSLLEIVIARLGHEAVVHHGGDPPSPLDAAVIEPGDGTGLELARRLRDRGVPVIFTSIFPATDEELELEPSAYLVKPFALYALENALAVALEPARMHDGF